MAKNSHNKLETYNFKAEKAALISNTMKSTFDKKRTLVEITKFDKTDEKVQHKANTNWMATWSQFEKRKIQRFPGLWIIELWFELRSDILTHSFIASYIMQIFIFLAREKMEKNFAMPHEQTIGMFAHFLDKGGKGWIISTKIAIFSQNL